MKRAFFSLICLIYSSGGFALPLPVPNLMESFNLYHLPPSHFSDNYDFEGIIALSNCSGSLVRFEDSSDFEPAMILTNGHCLGGGFLNPGEVVFNEKTSRSFTVLSKMASPLGKINADKIVYGTMTKTDMALYQLKETYTQILTKFNIAPLTLARDYADPETEIEIISGYWKKGYGCKHGGLVHKLKEGDWMWEDSIRFSQPGCETIPGTSGSPIIARGTKVVIGVNNTGNESGQKCTVNNPCEIDVEGNVTYKKGLSYGQQTAWIYSCLGADHQLDLSLPNCQLPR
jgi:hypothetical protein